LDCFRFWFELPNTSDWRCRCLRAFHVHCHRSKRQLAFRNEFCCDAEPACFLLWSKRRLTCSHKLRSLHCKNEKKNYGRKVFKENFNCISLKLKISWTHINPWPFSWT
jgi:hypothetical protein